MYTSDSNSLKFDDVIPQIAGLYRQGLLVPFIGAGMSFGVCRDWLGLLKEIGALQNLNWASNIDKTTPSNTLIRYADEVVSSMKPLSLHEQIKIYRKALNTGSKQVPKQTQALAELYWPLIISTNYDDVIWSSSRFERPTILGRGLEDCHAVLHSLNELSPPLLWSIQGFVGGQLKSARHVVSDEKRRMDLASQVVLGHQQYQAAINSSLHFRRAFAEVFRRRSLLFLGSSVTEDYFINLFGEIIHNQGSGPYPHFALLSKENQSKYDSLFMQQRFGIIPIFYEHHDDVPKYLNQFSGTIKYWLTDRKATDQLAQKIVFQDEIGFKLAARSGDNLIAVKLRICKGTIPAPETGSKACAVVSVGRDSRGPKIGTQALGLIKAVLKNKNNEEIADERMVMDAAAKQNWLSLDNPPAYVFRHKDFPVFGIAARSKKDSVREHDVRDLSIVSEAVELTLKMIDSSADNFETVNVGAVASGKQRCWDPIHPFAQTLIGIKQWASQPEPKNIKTINLYLIDPAPWASIVTRKIHLEALLTSDTSSHLIELFDTKGVRESFTITLKKSPTLKELLAMCKIDKSQWEISVYPLPTENDESIPDDLIITSTMRVILRPIS